MSRFTLLLAVAALWAAIYLPGLGTAELKGEEGRRILPAIAMLEGGSWVVPHLNGEPYFRKPPLINWGIALSMEALGQRDEWAARLPSVVAVLALALTLAWTGSRWLGAGGAFAAAVFFLTCISFIEKGRLAEIEAVYVALTGVAFASWLAAWARRESGWRLWLVPGIALGLGILAKGPLPHVLFFYGVVIPVLVAAGEKRELRSLAHLGSIAVMLGIAVAWYLPYRNATAGLNASAVMAEQIAERVGGGRFEWINLPRALANGLPWILFAPLWWSPRVLGALRAKDERLALLVRASRWPLLIGFAGLMLLKGMLPRYTLPLYPAMALILALAISAAGPGWLKGWRHGNRVLAAAASLFILAVLAYGKGWSALLLLVPAAAALGWAVWSFWKRRDGLPATLAAGSAVWAAAAVAVYGWAVLPLTVAKDDLRPVGKKVAEIVPAGAPIHVVDPGYEPSLFYVQRPLVYLSSVKKIPPEARYLLGRRGTLKKLKTHLVPRAAAFPLRGEGKKEFLLLKLSAEREKTPSPNRKAEARQARSEKLTSISKSND